MKKTFNLNGEISSGSMRRLSMQLADAVDSGECDEIEIRINSPGGEVFAATKVANQIRGYRNNGIKVTAYVEGLTASAATIIACSCDETYMFDNTFFMIHKPSINSKGNADQLRKDATTLDKIQDALLLVYCEKTGKPKAAIEKMVNEETWLSAKEAKDLGFIDDIVKVPRKGKAAATAHTPAYKWLQHSNGDMLSTGTQVYKISALADYKDLLAKIQEKGELSMDKKPIPMISVDLDEDAVEAEALQTAEPAAATPPEPPTPEKDPEKAPEQSADADEEEEEEEKKHEPPANAAAATAADFKAMSALINEQKKQLEALSNKLAFKDFLASLPEWNGFKMTEKHQQSLFKLSQFDKELYKDLTDVLTKASAAIEVTFEAKGSDVGQPVIADNDPHATLEALVSANMKAVEGMSYEEALTKAAIEHPDVYDAYRDSLMG